MIDLSYCKVKKIVPGYIFLSFNEIEPNRTVIFRDINSCKDILKFVFMFKHQINVSTDHVVPSVVLGFRCGSSVTSLTDNIND